MGKLLVVFIWLLIFTPDDGSAGSFAGRVPPRRSSFHLRQVLNSCNPTLQNYYNRLNGASPRADLRGKVVVCLEIPSSGIPENIRIVTSDWSHAAMGRHLERILLHQLERLNFDNETGFPRLTLRHTFVFG